MATPHANTTHGMSYTREHHIWTGILTRCYNPHFRFYSYYGGRGIGVHESWRHSFATFYRDMGPSNGLEIDRIDNDGDYAPGNCRWVTRSENIRNSRKATFIEYNGTRQTLGDWARQLGIGHPTLSKRRADGWSVPEILFGRRRAARMVTERVQ